MCVHTLFIRHHKYNIRPGYASTGTLGGGALETLTEEANGTQ